MHSRMPTRTILTGVALLAVAVGGMLLRQATTLSAGLLLIGIGGGIVLRTYLRERQ